MKKKHIAVLIGLILFLLMAGGAFFYVINLYTAKGLNLIKAFDTAYDYNGKLLLSKEGDEALLLKTLGKTDFETLSPKTISLDEFGFEGESLSYYTVKVEDDYGAIKTFLYTSDLSYEGFWPVLQEERLVYLAKDGKKYCIHPEENLCYPMFSDSIKGVDEFGSDVLAFSGNGSYALSLEGSVVTAYHTDPMNDSLRVVDKKEISLASYGTNIRFGAFLNDTDAYFTVKGEQGDYLLAVNCKTGEVAKSLLDFEGKYGKTLNRLYAQRLDLKQSGAYRATWSHLLLGTQVTSAKIEGVDQVELTAVSPGGTYALGVGESEGREAYFCMSKKKVFSISSLLEKEEKITDAQFIYENLIYITLENKEGKEISRCYKICFS